jgi:hypothetical protein
VGVDHGFEGCGSRANSAFSQLLKLFLYHSTKKQVSTYTSHPPLVFQANTFIFVLGQNRGNNNQGKPLQIQSHYCV